MTFSWVQIGSNISGENSGDSFGEGISLSSTGNIIAIGGKYNLGSGGDSGHVRIYQNINGIR